MTLPKPGDEFAEAWLRVGEMLLAKKNAGEMLTEAEMVVLGDAQEQARRSTRPPEVADDPTTLPDESRRPLLDGGDYNDRLKAMCAEEFKAAAERALTVLGEVVVRGIIEAAAKR